MNPLWVSTLWLIAAMTLIAAGAGLLFLSCTRGMTLPSRILAGWLGMVLAIVGTACLSQAAS